ncbi:BamA/TamA family outer membrane protein [Mucilaginibacter glaciei]|uniref:BamA/TamA family outer membrane protein n=1 Tax=Mucilaginibacter glaciei TaxID=2772109 RepID=A0A926NPF8_9SPHI|nr:BamA/TamA family outer membrane protein [Mucilaginibacter glaciei]MBD1392988.1 BamA/TamA family outer membrane protein [Mucilaginibacter glaciei]
MKPFILILFLSVFSIHSIAQKIAPSAWQKFPDSTVIKVHPSYNKRGNFHKLFFGENYRKEWAVPVKLPVFKISQVNGGLTVVKEGGGTQTKSLRLADKSGREWVLRTVAKVPDDLLPDELQETFAVTLVDDEFSAQHPFSALIVPPLADAASVLHTNPVIGVVGKDAALGKYSKRFAGKVCLLEEREPAGESDNTLKMDEKVIGDHDNRLDGEAFFRASLLDFLIGDWDRHASQWGWLDIVKGKGKYYEPVPKDRDQIFHVNQGVFPWILSQTNIVPAIGSFKGDIAFSNYWFYKTKFMKAYPDMQMSYDRMMQITREFMAAETDAVLEKGLRRLPREAYAIRHAELLKALKERREHLPEVIDKYYKFLYHIVDLRATNKNELFTFDDAPNQGLKLTITNLSKEGQPQDSLLNMVYDPKITKEIRLYTEGGDDQIVMNNARSPIKLRIIDSVGKKTYDVKQGGKFRVYGRKDSTNLTGDLGKVHTYFSNDSLNSKYLPTYQYDFWGPLATAGLNRDDGVLLGLGVRHTGYGNFRKFPYSTLQEVMLTHSFSTNAFRIRYRGEWIGVAWGADVILQAYIQAPDNTQNFFGYGNETILNKNGDYRTFYRSRFNTYEFDPSLRWRTSKHSTISVGPSVELYSLSLNDNSGRFITQQPLLHSYDSLTVDKSKAHAGLKFNFTTDHRNNKVFPSSGFFFTVTATGYSGLNSNSDSYAQLRPEFTYYQKLTSSGSVVIYDRIGGGVSLGKPAFYQSMYLGGQGNLLGYLQYRFAGKHMAFNNLQARAKIAKIDGYILPGELGAIGFYDTGRVWVDNDNSSKWHSGIGGGAYFAPASLIVVEVLAGHSTEGWYPYVSLNFRL